MDSELKLRPTLKLYMCKKRSSKVSQSCARLIRTSDCEIFLLYFIHTYKFSVGERFWSGTQFLLFIACDLEWFITQFSPFNSHTLQFSNFKSGCLTKIFSVLWPVNFTSENLKARHTKNVVVVVFQEFLWISMKIYLQNKFYWNS